MNRMTVTGLDSRTQPKTEKRRHRGPAPGHCSLNRVAPVSADLTKFAIGNAPKRKSCNVHTQLGKPDYFRR
jgi:hypothetical protein